MGDTNWSEFPVTVVVEHTQCLVVSNCRFVSSIVVVYSFLCSNAIPHPYLVVLFTTSILKLLLCRPLVSIHALSSSKFFNQVSVRMMKLVFSVLLVSLICCCLFFIDVTFIIAILIIF